MSENNVFPRRSEIFRSDIKDVRDIIARPSLDTFYQVNFSFGNIDTWLKDKPDKNRTQGQGFQRKMSILCTQAELPGTSYVTSSAIGHHQGIQEEFPNLRNFPPLNLVFYCDADMVVLEVLETWMTYINPIQTNQRDRSAFTRFNYPEDYKEILHVTKFERDTFKEKGDFESYQANMTSYEFVNLWPTDLTSMRVAYGDSNVLKCSVQFAYDRFFTRFNYRDSNQSVINTPVDLTNSKEIRDRMIPNLSNTSPQELMTGGINKNSLRDNVNAGINAFPYR